MKPRTPRTITAPQYPATLLCDFYKILHRDQYPDKSEIVYSTWTPRSNKHFPVTEKVSVFGHQGFIQQWLIDYFNDNFFNLPIEEVLQEYREILQHCLFIETPKEDHIRELHALGYLPLCIEGIEEGERVPFRIPVLTMYNTDSRFFWLTNYFESLFSSESFQAIISTTIAYEYRKILTYWALKTVGNDDFVDFQGHDFSMRGMGFFTGAQSGAGHLNLFRGTDSIHAIKYHEFYYNGDITAGGIGCSVPATEHSVQCAGGNTLEEETETYRRLIEDIYPSGIASIVSDTWDLWQVINTILPALKEKIMARDGKVVIRPDSGDPVKILTGYKVYEADGKLGSLNAYDFGAMLGQGYEAVKFSGASDVYVVERTMDGNGRLGSKLCVEEVKGVVELLWDLFGGTESSEGYKLLDEHIGAIYGDAITLERAEQTCKRLADKGFASINVVFGIGSYTYQYNTRDTLGLAMKATWISVDGVGRQIFKDPKTDDGVKKSNKGVVRVFLDDNGEYYCEDGYDHPLLQKDETRENQLKLIFLDGKLMNETTTKAIRGRLRGFVLQDVVEMLEINTYETEATA